MDAFLAVVLMLMQVVGVDERPKKVVVSGTSGGYEICECFTRCETCRSYDNDGNLIITVTICPVGNECK